MKGKRGMLLVGLLVLAIVSFMLISNVKAAACTPDGCRSHEIQCPPESGHYCSSYNYVCHCYGNGGCIVTGAGVSYDRYCYNETHFYYRGCVDNQHPGGVWGPYACPSNTPNCTDPNGQCVSAPPPQCYLNSVTVEPYNCGTEGCETGDKIKVTAQYSTGCAKLPNPNSPAWIQVDLNSTDNVCNIQFTDTYNLGPNKWIKGATFSCTGSICIAYWTIPEVPIGCKGKEMIPYSTGLYNNSNITPSYWVAGNNYPDGYFNFKAQEPLPGAFNLINPPNNTIGVPVAPTFTWQVSTGAVAYTLQIDDENTFTFPLIYENATVSSPFLLPITLSAGTSYWWRIIARNAYGSTIASNAPFKFTTVGQAPTPCNITDANIQHYCGTDGCNAGESIAMNITVENMTKCDALNVNKMEMSATIAGEPLNGCDVTMINTTPIYRNTTTKTYYANWTVSVPPGCYGRTVYAKTAKLYNASGVIGTKTVVIPPGYGNFTFASGIPTQLDYILLIPASASLTVPYALDYSVFACYTTGGCNQVTALAKYNSSNVSRANFITTGTPNRITAISAGSVTVTANYTEGGITKYATAALEVLPQGQVVLSHIIIEPVYNSTTIGNNQSYTVTAFKSNGTSYDVTLHANTTYNSSNLSVATMHVSPKNKALAVGLGRANITANYTEGAKKVSAYAILNVTGAGELKTFIITPQPICVDSGSMKSSEYCYKPNTPAWCPINLSYYALKKNIYFNQSTQGSIDNWTWFFSHVLEPNLKQSGTNIALANITYKYLTLVGQKMEWKTVVFLVNDSQRGALDIKIIPVVDLNNLPNNFAPLIKIISPQNGQVLQGCSHVFNASVCDDNTPATQLKVNFSIMKGTQTFYKQATCYNNGNCNTTYNFASNGNYMISAFVFDNANNMGWDGYKYVTVTGCGTGPTNCSDGTPINQCSQVNLGMWCNANAVLEPGCATRNCPCPPSQFCNTSSNTCINQGNTQTCTTPPASLNERNCTNFGCCWDACQACSSVPANSRACSKYNGSYACERDVCGFGKNGIGTNGCGTPLKENCTCAWNGTACNLVWTSSGGSYTCTSTGESVQTCANADKWITKYTFTSNPPGFEAQCCQQSGHTCTDNWYTVEGPCGVVFRPLPFFEWWQVIIVIGVIAIVYIFISRQEKKRQS